jgi:hypothetical protein
VAAATSASAAVDGAASVSGDDTIDASAADSVFVSLGDTLSQDSVRAGLELLSN